MPRENEGTEREIEGTVKSIPLTARRWTPGPVTETILITENQKYLTLESSAHREK